jgi:hypothetical protein
MITIKGRYNGAMVVFDSIPHMKECDVIVNFPDASASVKTADDGSLAYLFRDYSDDGIREPIVDFGDAVGKEQW